MTRLERANLHSTLPPNHPVSATSHQPGSAQLLNDLLVRVQGAGGADYRTAITEVRTSIFQTRSDAVKVVPMRASNWEITSLLLQS